MNVSVIRDNYARLFLNYYYFAVKRGEISIRHKVVMAITSTSLWLPSSSLLLPLSLFLTEPPGNRCPVQSAVCQGLQLIVEIFIFIFFTT